MPASADLMKLTVTMGVKSGIPRDSVQFDLYYRHAEPRVDADFDNMRDHIIDFLTIAPSTFAAALQTRLGDVLSISADKVEVRFYDVPAAPGALGAPIATRTGHLTGVGGSSLPEEVAAVLSFRGIYGSLVEFGAGATRPRARVRNRIYLGPLAVSAKDQDTTTKRTFVHQDLIDIATGSARDRLFTDAAADGWTWSVFSRTNWQDFSVAFVSMDNAFDIQRRRGPDPTARTEITL
jgi:hypothetical protein